MSTFQYELVPLPNSVRKCYDYSQRFTNCYRHYSQNIIIQHRDQKIMGKNRFGDLAFSYDFKFVYYCLSRYYVMVKNNPYVYASPEAFTYFDNDLELKTIICKAGLVLCSP